MQHYESAVSILHGQLKGKVKATGIEGGETESDIRKNIVRVLVAMVEVWMSPTYDLWCVLLHFYPCLYSCISHSFEPNAESTCESLLQRAFETDPDNIEAWISLSSLRLSQQREDDAKVAAIKAWESWKDASRDSADESKIPPIPTRIELAKRFIELTEYNQALLVLQTVMASDDQEVEAWYLEGWCFFLLAEKARENGAKVEDLSWEELAQDGRDALERCQMVRYENVCALCSS